MGRALEVPVKPDVLRWARETIGKKPEDVATRLQIEMSTVLAWEEGEGHPTLSQLRELAKYLKRPLAAFFLPFAPLEPALPGAFRRLPADQREPLSKATLLAIRRARRTQELVRELAAPESGSKGRLPVGRALLSDDARQVADNERHRLGITPDQQFGWANNGEAYLSWKRTLEEKGLIILELSMPVREARAFSLMDEVAPLIVVNGLDSSAGRIFSLFHEYGHLLLGRSGMADFTEEDRLTNEGKETERFCNHFAGALLVPETALLQSSVVKSHPVDAEWEDTEVEALAAIFNVSEYVITRRLLMKRLISLESYGQRAARYEGQLPPRKYGRRVPAKTCVRQNGVPFVSIVFKAHANDRITYRDVADYLYVKPKHLQRVAEVLSSNAVP
ncbi:MAG: ImmA/IrrE family metallo-endopeptidase [Candidatus Coatesbacteria bacterium]|nr:ImmA/IrrE family metallo-endopeptidase [Candidatus Coatesbacteria bacterium]